MKSSLANLKRGNLLRTLLDNTPIAYIVLDEDYKIHYINESFLKLRMLDKATALGEKCYNMSNNGVMCVNCSVKSTFVYDIPDLIIRKDTFDNGTTRYIDDYAFPLKTKINGKKYALEIMIDRSREFSIKAQLFNKYQEIIKCLMSLIEIKDSYTAQHSINVQKLAMELGKYLGLDDDSLFTLSLSALLHDVGKVKIPSFVLNKPEKLTNEEFDVIKSHSKYSYEILDGLKSFDKIKYYVRDHHERPDGKGYPNRLKGTDISIFSKIISIADCYDAMISKRCYKNPMNKDIALYEIKKGLGSQFDKDIGEAFINLKKGYEPINLKNHPKKIIRNVQKLAASSIDKSVENLSPIDDDLIEQIWANSPCAHVVIDTNGIIIFASHFFQRLFHFDKTILGKKINTVMRSTHNFTKCIKNKEIINSIFTYNEYGEDRFFEISEVPYISKDHYDAIIITFIERTIEFQIQNQLKTDFNDLTNKLSAIVDYIYKDLNNKNLLDNREQINKMKERLKELKQSLFFN